MDWRSSSAQRASVAGRARAGARDSAGAPRGRRRPPRGADPVDGRADRLAGLAIDYVAVAPFDGRPTLVVAARVGTTRLIDNVPLEHPELAGLPKAGS